MTQSEDPRLSEVIADFLQAIDAGSRPDADDYVRRHPDLADGLRAFFADQAAVDRLAAPFRSGDGNGTQSPEANPDLATITQVPGEDLPQPGGHLGSRLPLEPVGRGVGFEQRLLHHVGRIDLGPESRVQPGPRQDEQVTAVPVEPVRVRSGHVPSSR